MAKVKYSPIIDDVRCRLGNIMVFSKWKDTSYLRTYAKPGDPKSPGQMEVRSAFIRLTKNWREVGGVLHRCWKNHAKGMNMTGYKCLHWGKFIAAEKRRAPGALQGHRRGEALGLHRWKKDLIRRDCLRLHHTFSSSGKHLTIFTQKLENGKAEGDMVRHDMGAVNGTHAVIQGLEPAAQYFVYAVVTRAAYPEAETVSASSAGMTEAA